MNAPLGYVPSNPNDRLDLARTRMAIKLGRENGAGPGYLADIADRLADEVERLDILLTVIGNRSDEISDTIVHYREFRS